MWGSGRENEKKLTPRVTTFAEHSKRILDSRNLIVSGGTTKERVVAIYSLVSKARDLNIPTIVIHCNNPFLTTMPLSKIWGFEPLVYDPAKDKSSTQLADVLTEAAVNELDSDKGVFILIQLIVDIIEAVDGHISFERVLCFPVDKLVSEVAKLNESGKITLEQRSYFTKRYGGDASNHVSSVARLFSRLLNSWKTKDGVSFKHTIDSRDIITFNLIADTNNVLKELVFADINILMQSGQYFLLVVDSASILGKDGSQTDAVLLRNQGNYSLLYSAADIPQLVLQKDEKFNTLVGGHTDILLFQHSNGASAQKWATFFGQEWVTIAECSTTKTSMTWKFGNDSTGLTVNQKLERADYYPQEIFMQEFPNQDAVGIPERMKFGIPKSKGIGFFFDFTKEKEPIPMIIKFPKINDEILQCLTDS